MDLTRVICGGQTGADQAALWSARKAGLNTGGFAPHTWQTEDGPAPWLARFGLVEHRAGYWERSEANTRDADATLNFLSEPIGPGTSA